MKLNSYFIANILLISTFCSPLARQQAHEQLPYIAYADLMDQQSPIGKFFADQPVEQKINALWALGSQEWLSSSFCITQVPCMQGTATLTIVLDRVLFNKLVITVYKDKTPLLEGLFYWGTRTASLELLTGTGKIDRFPRTISGSTLLYIWEVLCKFCAIRTASIEDVSCYKNCFELRILLPYIYGVSFYGKVGYFPTCISRTRYLDAVKTLASRTAEQLIADAQYADNTKAITTVQQALACCNLARTASLSEVVTALYIRWRADSASCEKLLHDMYIYFLESYPDCPDQENIYALQQKVYSKNLKKKFL